METVYADALVLLNAALDYLLLLSAGKLCALPLRRGRIALGALWGGAYALLAVLLPDFFTLFTVKLLAGALAVVLAYGWNRRLPKVLAAFFAVSAAFGGAIYAAAGLAGQEAGEGAYFPVSFRMLVLSFALCYAGISLAFRGLGRRANRRLYRVELRFQGRSIDFLALADSGNELRDPLTGAEVLVASREALLPLFPDPAPLYLDPPEALEALRRAGCPGFRLVPCSSVGAASLLLLCFTPEELRVDGRPLRDLAVAISPNPLSPAGEFEAVVNL